jgi:hypothetical protein
MLIAIAIGIVIILLIVLSGKKEQNIEIEDIDESVFDDSDVIKLRVFHKGNEILENKIITVYELFSEFTVEGYNLEGERKVLMPKEMLWKSG